MRAGREKLVETSLLNVTEPQHSTMQKISLHPQFKPTKYWDLEFNLSLVTGFLAKTGLLLRVLDYKHEIR